MKEKFCITCFVVGLITAGVSLLAPSCAPAPKAKAFSQCVCPGVALWNLDIRISALSNRVEKLEKALRPLEVKPLTEAIECYVWTNRWPYAVSQEEGVAK